jgi:putative intracellular protease/amidase
MTLKEEGTGFWGGELISALETFDRAGDNVGFATPRGVADGPWFSTLTVLDIFTRGSGARGRSVADVASTSPPPSVASCSDRRWTRTPSTMAASCQPRDGCVGASAVPLRIGAPDLGGAW